MKRFQKTKKFLQRAAIALAALSLGACEVGSSSMPRQPYRAPSSGTSGAISSQVTAEVGTSVQVSVTVKDKKGYGIGGVVPTISAIGQTSGNSVGVTSGGCSVTDLNGLSVCTLSATVAQAYSLEIVSPVQETTSSKVTYLQYARALQFSTQPQSSVQSAVAFNPQPIVKVLDRVGNYIANYPANTVTMSLTSAGSATLGGTNTDSPGVATGTYDFTGKGMTIDLVGTYTLTATLVDATTGTITATSSSIAITPGPASKLKFTTSPSDTPVNVNFSPQPVVAVEDAGGNVVTSSTCPVTLSLNNIAGTDTLVGTLTVTAQSGVADFKNSALRVSSNLSGSHTLQATVPAGACGGFTAPSNSFNITLAGTPDHLVVLTPPSASPLNVTWPTQPVVEVVDSSGNLVSTDNQTVITVAIASGAGGTLQGSTSVLVTNGVANFSGVQTNGTSANAGNYVLNFSATNPSYTAVSSSTVSVNQVINSHGVDPAKLAFKVQPANVAVNQVEPSIVVQVDDSGGFYCSTDNTSSVNLRVSTGPGVMLQNGVVVGAGGVTVTAASGLATFSGIAFSAQGTYTLLASGTHGATILTNGYSNTFAVAAFGTADHVNFFRQPVSTGTTAGTPWSTQPQVEILDVQGNRVTSDNSTVVTLTCVSPGSCGGLLGTTSGTAVNGLVDFTGHQLRTNQSTAPLANVVLQAASSPAYISADSNNFTENPGAANPAVNITFTTEPTDVGPYTCRPWSTQPIVTLTDINGNVATADSTTQVTLTCVAGCAGLIGQKTVTVVNGVANFRNSGLYSSNDACGGAGVAGIQVQATTNTGLTPRNSNAFTGN